MHTIFFDNPWPATRNPLNSIVPSPRSISVSACDLTDAQHDFGDCQSFLPPAFRCLLQGGAAGGRRGALTGWIAGRRWPKARKRRPGIPEGAAA